MKAQGVPVLQFLNLWYKWYCQWLSWIFLVQIKLKEPKWQWQVCKEEKHFHYSLKRNVMSEQIWNNKLSYKGLNKTPNPWTDNHQSWYPGDIPFYMVQMLQKTGCWVRWCDTFWQDLCDTLQHRISFTLCDVKTSPRKLPASTLHAYSQINHSRFAHSWMHH